jgi:hypothetical protein
MFEFMMQFDRLKAFSIRLEEIDILGIMLRAYSGHGRHAAEHRMASQWARNKLAKRQAPTILIITMCGVWLSAPLIVLGKGNPA